jgi:hypothetical protein
MNQLRHIKLYNWTLQAQGDFSPEFVRPGFGVF